MYVYIYVCVCIYMYIYIYTYIYTWTSAPTRLETETARTDLNKYDDLKKRADLNLIRVRQLESREVSHNQQLEKSPCFRLAIHTLWS